MSDAAAIVQALGGRWKPHARKGYCRCPAHNDRRPSLSVGEGRDGKLLLRCHAGCEFRDIVEALRMRGLLAELFDRSRTLVDPKIELARQREAVEERKRRIAHARRTWGQAQLIGGSLAETYLRRRRSISAPLPATLRFATADPHFEAGQRLPAMIGAIECVSEPGLVGVHLTYLDHDGRKASVKPNKRMRGIVQGGAVRLFDGPGPLVVAEGIETALSLFDRFAHHQPRVWSALSAGGVSSLELPSTIGELVVAPDPDLVGWNKSEALANRAHRDGWRVSMLPPPGDGVDWNDQAMAEAAA